LVNAARALRRPLDTIAMRATIMSKSGSETRGKTEVRWPAAAQHIARSR
jgi:hypothetical protein